MIMRLVTEENDILIAEDSIDAVYTKFEELLRQHLLKQVEMTENDEYLLSRLFDCVQRVSKTIPGSCPLIFDSWSCFNSTPAGSVQKEPCPDFEIFNFSPSRFASKECDEKGSWLVHP